MVFKLTKIGLARAEAAQGIDARLLILRAFFVTRYSLELLGRAWEIATAYSESKVYHR